MKLFTIIFSIFFMGFYLFGQNLETIDKNHNQAPQNLENLDLMNNYNQMHQKLEALLQNSDTDNYHSLMQDIMNENQRFSEEFNKDLLSDEVFHAMSMDEDDLENRQTDYETESQDSQLISLTINELEPNISDFKADKLIITESISNGELTAFAQSLELSNQVSGSNTNVSYAASQIIVCENGFSATNGHTVFKIVEPNGVEVAQNSSTSDFTSKEWGNHLIDMDSDKVLSVYPNPTSSKINIELPKVSNGMIVLYDVAGNIVYQNKLRAKNLTEINLEALNLKKGMYLLTINVNDKKYSKNILYN